MQITTNIHTRARRQQAQFLASPCPKCQLAAPWCVWVCVFAEPTVCVCPLPRHLQSRVGGRDDAHTYAHIHTYTATTVRPAGEQRKLVRMVAAQESLVGLLWSSSSYPEPRHHHPNTVSPSNPCRHIMHACNQLRPDTVRSRFLNWGNPDSSVNRK